MLRIAFFALIMLTLVISFYGCGSSGVHLRSYIEDKPRVDQEVSGNQGYLQGKSDELPTRKKKTRKMYVLEISKEAEEAQDITIETQEKAKPTYEESMNLPAQESKPVTNFDTDLDIPSFDDESMDMPASQEGQVVQYTVEKDDTLQKISQKFYNSHSKWPKIYEANKDKIKNPDRIKPGIVLSIPLE